MKKKKIKLKEIVINDSRKRGKGGTPKGEQQVAVSWGEEMTNEKKTREKTGGN